MNIVSHNPLDFAIEYARMGHKVLPLHWRTPIGTCSCGGRAGCKPAKHPYGTLATNGFYSATTDEATISKWWKAYPQANVGLAVENAFVLDIDARSGGLTTLEAWEREYGKLPKTPLVFTGGGGWHYYLDAGTGFVFPTEKIGVGVDIQRPKLSYLVAPPSVHISGNRYEWVEPLTTPIADAPEWLLQKMRDASKPKPKKIEKKTAFDPMRWVVASGDTFAELGKLSSGERNGVVNGVIGTMLGHGYPSEKVIEQGLFWAEQQEPPYSADDIEAKVKHFAGKDARKNKVAEVIIEAAEGEPLGNNPFASSHFAGSQSKSDEATPYPVSLYYGITGDFIKAVEPHTEADGVGILACLLCGIGSIIGRGVHHDIGRRHAGNLFVLLTGNTTERKGTCWDVAESVLSMVAPEWAHDCIDNGFGSGQGLIDRIRDANEQDDGVADKRLLVVEEEFSKPMRLFRSEKDILSPALRTAFDGKPLSVMNRTKNRYGCREPHVSVIGMIPPDELLELLKGRTELVNGFLNRFLCIGVQRTRYLPSKTDYKRVGREYAERFRHALKTAVALTEKFEISDEAANYWEAEYRRLEQERKGNYGKAVARLSVHALKVGMLYAALDGKSEIGLSHLQAALALVAHADATAQALFGGKPPEDPPHLRLLQFARQQAGGVTKTEALRLFSNHRKRDDIEADFALLTAGGFGRWEGERWKAREHWQPATQPPPCEPTKQPAGEQGEPANTKTTASSSAEAERWGKPYPSAFAWEQAVREAGWSINKDDNGECTLLEIDGTEPARAASLRAGATRWLAVVCEDYMTDAEQEAALQAM